MKNKMKWFSVLLMACVALLSSCSNDDSSSASEGEADNGFSDAVIKSALEKMTLREKVGQMFIVRPEALDTSIHWETYQELVPYETRSISKAMKALNGDYPVGGMILFAHNIDDESQLVNFIKDIKSLNGAPLLAVDEEGGRVARIANDGSFDVPKYESMEALAALGEDSVYEAAFTIGSYVKHYGFDVDFAPVADVNTNPENIVIGARAFSNEPEVAATMVQQYLRGLEDAHVVGSLKHFPGHGDVKSDTHYGYAETQKTWDEMLKCEMIPFVAGIKAGAQMVMTAHIAAPKVTNDDVPATLSSVILQDKLRGELGFEGVIVTDAMDMGAIMKQFTNVEATVKSIQAGIDIVLCPQNFVEAFDAVVKAVEDGAIKESRIDESVYRILKMKNNLKN